MNRVLLFTLSIGIAALAFVGLTLVLTLGLAFAAAGLVALAARKVLGAIRCTAGEEAERESGPIQRVWNDGKGTIIDM